MPYKNQQIYKEYHRKYELSRKGKRLDYYEANKEHFKETSKLWRLENKQKRSEYDKQYRLKNRKLKNEINKRYRMNNKERVLLSNKIYSTNRKRTDVQYRLACSLRSRLGNAIRNKTKTGSAVKDLGCSIAELKTYLEKQFKDGMSWNNWGCKGWHIDHKLPLTYFDLTDRKQFLSAVHFSNLQPLWAMENIRKGNRIHLCKN